MCRSRRELSNEYLLAKIGVDTAENEPLEVWGENSIQYSIVSLLVRRGLLEGRPVDQRDAGGWGLSGRLSAARLDSSPHGSGVVAPFQDAFCTSNTISATFARVKTFFF